MTVIGDNALACSWEAAPQSPRLSGEEVHVWRTTLTRAPGEVERLRGLLSDDELRRAECFHFLRDRASFIVARGTLREILSLYVGVQPRLLRFGYNAFGKPELIGASGGMSARFNLAHSGGLALYAVAAGREVGVDVEAVRDDVPCEEVAASFFSRREAAALLALSASARTLAFFECWTRKEAYIKGRGNGLSLPLSEFDVTLVPGEPAALLDTRFDEQEAACWSLRELITGPGYAAAVAVEGSGWRLRCWRWPCDEDWAGGR